MISVTAVADQGEFEIVSAIRKLLENWKPEPIGNDSSVEAIANEIHLQRSQTESEELAATDKRPETGNQADSVDQAKCPTQETVTSPPLQLIAEVGPQIASSTSSGCQYGFGYLSQREKGETIPGTCVECAKSLECMLSQYYKAGESVKEIKKWYDL